MRLAAPVDRANQMLLGFAVAVVPLLALAPPLPRGLLALVLIGFAPGYAMIRPLRLADTVLVVVTTIAVSLGVATLVSTLLFYSHLWSWQLCAGVLAVVTVVAVLGSAGGSPLYKHRAKRRDR